MSGEHAFSIQSPSHNVLSQSQNSPYRIRVRISRNERQVVVRGMDLHFARATSARAQDFSVESARPSTSLTEAKVRCHHGRVWVNSDQHIPWAVSVSSPAGFISWNGKSVREELRIQAIAGGGEGCEIVNVLDLERYLDAVVGGEFNAHWNPEAVKAQIIAARTYAIYQILQARKKNILNFDVESTVSDQVYQGPEHEHFKSARLVESTRGVVLGVQDVGFRPIKAFYHSMCGGETELPERVWGKKYPGLGRVKCPFCHLSPGFNWSFQVPLHEIEDLVRLSLRGKSIPQGVDPRTFSWIVGRGNLNDAQVELDERGIRVKRVNLMYRVPHPSNGKILNLELPISAALIRSWLGASRIRSTEFEIHTRALGDGQSSLVFSGKGFGHGVGMCQWGAKFMGDRGTSTVAILRHYYPGAEIRKLW